MKNRTNLLLFLGLVLSLAFYLWLMVFGIRLGWFVLWPWLALTAHAVPAFCLQLLLCRVSCWRVVKALPLSLVLGAALLAGCGFLIATGWDALGWGILLAGCIAPAVGCALALVFYHLRETYKRGDIRG